jgi:hypothetical protein
MSKTTSAFFSLLKLLIVSLLLVNDHCINIRAAPMMKSISKKASQTFSTSSGKLSKSISELDAGSWSGPGAYHEWTTLEKHAADIVKLLLDKKNKVVPAEILGQFTENNYEINVFKALAEITTEKKEYSHIVVRRRNLALDMLDLFSFPSILTYKLSLVDVMSSSLCVCNDCLGSRGRRF